MIGDGLRSEKDCGDVRGVLNVPSSMHDAKPVALKKAVT
jgi:hypothetical protein